MSASIKEIKLRISGIQSTMQITKAMEMVSSAKLVGAKNKMQKSRPFFEILQETLDEISATNKNFGSVYTKIRDVKNICVLVISGDRGLAGGYNSNVIKMAVNASAGKPFFVLPVGLKALEYMKKTQEAEILTSDYSMLNSLSVSDCYNIGRLLARYYRKGKFDELYVVYTKYVSALSFSPVKIKILPLQSRKETANKKNILYEGGKIRVFDNIVPQYIGGIIYGAAAESLVSEHACRKNAMQSATDNAKEITDDLKLMYNRVRQGMITRELTEIVAGSGL